MTRQYSLWQSVTILVLCVLVFGCSSRGQEANSFFSYHKQRAYLSANNGSLLQLQPGIKASKLSTDYVIAHPDNGPPAEPVSLHPPGRNLRHNSAPTKPKQE